MKRIDLNISLIAIMGLVMVVSGCINGQNEEQNPNITQNFAIKSPESTITAEVEIGQVKLSHTNGDDIPMNNFTIIIEQGDLYAIYEKMGQADDKFAKGDTLDLEQNSVSLNGKEINSRISINNSGVIGLQTTITLLSSGQRFARIVSNDGFFG